MTDTLTTASEEMAPPSPRQRSAARMADAAGGRLRWLIFKIALLAIVDAVAVFAVFVLFLHNEWLVLALVAAVTILVNYIGTEEVQLELFEAGNILPALTAAADSAASDPIIAGFQAVGADAVPMPAIPAMGSVWEFWGVAEAAIINGSDPATTWQKLVDDVTTAIK